MKQLNYCAIAVVALLASTSCGDESDRPTGLTPTIASVSPDHTGLPGGELITITGSNFLYGEAGESIVVFGSTQIADVTVVDDATITFLAPPGNTPGTVNDVSVFNGNGYVTATAAVLYNDPAAAFEIDIQSAPLAGNVIATIRGRGFSYDAQGPTIVTVGGAQTDEVTIVSDSELQVVIPAMANTDKVFLPLPVTLSNPNGTIPVPSTITYTKRGILFFGTRSSPAGFYFNPETMDITPISGTAANNGYAIDSSDKPYQLQITGSRQRILVQGDPLGTRTVIGAVLSQDQPVLVRDLIITPTGSFTINKQQRQLGAISLTTGEFTNIGVPFPFPTQYLAIGYRSAQALYLTTQLNQPLYSVSTVDGSYTPLVTLNGPSNLFCHGMVTYDGVLYLLAHDRSTSVLYTVNLDTGDLTEIATLTGRVGSIGPTPASYE